MNKTAKILLLCLCALSLTVNAAAWGQKGHDVICAVAREHLSRKASKEVSLILDGKSIVYWANWMDNASHTREYSYSKTWHYKDIGEDETYENSVLEPRGDVVTAITALTDSLKTGILSSEGKARCLKMLIHLVGDLHCPGHLAQKKDKGGNKRQLRFFNQGTNMHSLWDTGIVERAHKWTFSEWAWELDTKDKAYIAEVCKGNADSWAKETYLLTCRIYEDTPVGAKLSFDYVTKWTPSLEEQLLKGGLRLAKVLNDIFK